MVTNPLAARSTAYWDFFIAECVRLKAPLYLRLTAGVRDDPRLRALAELGRPGQPIANLLFGAVHYLLLRGAEHELRAYYRTLGGSASGGDPFPLFRDFCLRHEAEIASIVASRTVNTNEVGRSVFLHTGFLAMAREAPGPFHMIEVGPSAGLNLHWDSYGYRFLKDGAVLTSGTENAALVLEAAVTGASPPLGASPSVGSRVGLERHPVNLADPRDRDWLKALVWPDHPGRFQRMERALAAAQGLPADIRKGDALALLPDALAECPREGTQAVVHTMAIYQFKEEERRALDDLLTLASLWRPVWRLSLEWADDLYPLILSRYTDGARADRTLALCDSHGNEMHWFG